MNDFELEDIGIPSSTMLPSSEHIMNGMPVPAIKRIELFSPDEWEEFIQEWAQGLFGEYVSVQKFAGAGDQGRDIVGFCDQKKFHGIWDLYQCKFYQSQLKPSDVWVEFGKLIYHTFSDQIQAPRRYLFMAPKGVGLALQKLLADHQELKRQIRDSWDGACARKIKSNADIKLDGDLLAYFEAFDFSIFSSMSAPDLIAGHSKTPYHATRFGGGLPPVPNVVNVPEDIQAIESRYITQLFEAYSDHKKENITLIKHLDQYDDIQRHFKRSRESFYSAEVLRNFARDNVPPGTFERLQDDIYDGVIDICEAPYIDGLERLRHTLSKATDLPLANNPLNASASPKSKGGICHQLANEDRLIWVQKN